MLLHMSRLLFPILRNQSPPQALYHTRVVDHYENPRNAGSFDKKEENVATGIVGAPACGDVMKLQIKYDPQTHVIKNARFKTFGCGSAIASSSLTSEWIKEKSFEEAKAIIVLCWQKTLFEVR